MLVIVSGAPGSGKSTLAKRIATELHLPLLMKDELKESIADAVGIPSDVDGSMRLGDAAYAALAVAARRVLESGCSVIVESNFRRGVSEPYLEPLVRHSGGRLIHCTAPAEVIRDRYAARFERQERHPAHRDSDRGPALADDLDSGRFEPLRLDVPLLVVETIDGYRPDLPNIVAFCSGP